MGKFKDLVNSADLVLVDFYADWCGPCKMLSPLLQEIAKERGGKVKVVKINVDKNKLLATDMAVRSVPTLMLYKKGKQVWKQAGAPQKQQLLSIIDSHIN